MEDASPAKQVETRIPKKPPPQRTRFEITWPSNVTTNGKLILKARYDATSNYNGITKITDFETLREIYHENIERVKSDGIIERLFLNIIQAELNYHDEDVAHIGQILTETPLPKSLIDEEKKVLQLLLPIFGMSTAISENVHWYLDTYKYPTQKYVYGKAYV